MEKKHIVRLTKRQRQSAELVAYKLDGSPQKVKRAQILLKADQREGGWTDAEICATYSCTVENVRQRFAELGFQVTLDGKKRANPPRERKFDGEAGGRRHRRATQ